MTISITVSNLVRDVTSRRVHRGKIVTSGTYVTNGFALAPADLGLHTIDRLGFTNPAGYVLEYVPSTNKVKVYWSGTVTPAGTITVTDGAVTVTGGQSAGAALQITPDTAAGVLGKTAATSRVIPQTTFGIAATTAAFSGSATTAAALAEVDNGTSLALTLYFEASGT